MTLEGTSASKGSSAGGKKSVSARAYDRLRVAIISGRLEPGRPLRLADLSEQMNMSMSAVREALIRLSENQIVTLAPNQGFRVMEVSREDFAELTELRVLLETTALRASISNGNAEWEAQVIATHHVLEQAPFRIDGQAGTTVDWARAHMRFHAALCSACGNQRMLDTIANLSDSAEIYRQLSSRTRSNVNRDIAGEHRELMELAVACDTEAAIDALARHLRTTRQRLDEMHDNLIAQGLPADGRDPEGNFGLDRI